MLHELEFCPLLLLGELVANGTRGEAALRRERETLKRNILGCLVDAGYDGILVLEFGTLRSDKTEHHMFVGAHLSQWLEAAGALVVVFEIEHVDILAGEHPIGYGVVGSAVEPCGMVIAATDVCSHYKVGRAAFEGEVIDTEELIFHEIEIAVEVLVAL